MRCFSFWAARRGRGRDQTFQTNNDEASVAEQPASQPSPICTRRRHHHSRTLCGRRPSWTCPYHGMPSHVSRHAVGTHLMDTVHGEAAGSAVLVSKQRAADTSNRPRPRVRHAMEDVSSQPRLPDSSMMTSQCRRTPPESRTMNLRDSWLARWRAHAG